MKTDAIKGIQDNVPAILRHYNRFELADLTESTLAALEAENARLREALQDVCYDSAGNKFGDSLLESLGNLDHAHPSAWAFSQGWIAWLTRQGEAIVEASRALSSAPSEAKTP